MAAERFESEEQAGVPSMEELKRFAEAEKDEAIKKLLEMLQKKDQQIQWLQKAYAVEKRNTKLLQYRLEQVHYKAGKVEVAYKKALRQAQSAVDNNLVPAPFL